MPVLQSTGGSRLDKHQITNGGVTSQLTKPSSSPHTQINQTHNKNVENKAKTATAASSTKNEPNH